MTKIARLTDGYYLNFDDHCLYSKDGKAIELNIQNQPFKVLEYLCDNPNCYKRNIDINNYLDKGCLADVTIRGYIHKLRDAHPIIRKVLDSNSNGYIYKGSKTEEITPSALVKHKDQPYSVAQFIKTEEKYEIEFLKTLMYCSCKWGACTLDSETQNTNTCEGVLAILSSEQKDRYVDIVDEALEQLLSSATNRGLVSKSLDEETVVPSSMLVLLALKLNHKNDSKIQMIADALWNSRSVYGWGLYVRNMGADSNIGCTYWAIKALSEYNCVQKNEFQRFLRSLFRYDDSYVFGHTINDYRSKMPKLYATSMMCLIYGCLSNESKKTLGRLYNYNKAIEYIVNHFDDPISLVESEGINGVEAAGKTWVHTVNWNHMSINYALMALSEAIRIGAFSESELLTLLKRIEKVIIDNCDEDNGLTFWSAPTMSLDKGSRGKMVFPTMHLIMGISAIRDAVTYYMSKQTNGEKYE